MDPALKKIRDSQLLEPLHSEGLTWSRLSVSKYGDCAGVKDKVQDWSHTNVVELLVWVIVVKGIVKLEVLVFNEFCYAVYLKFILVNDYTRVTERDTVDLAILKFLGEDWPLFYADTDFQLISRNVLKPQWVKTTILGLLVVWLGHCLSLARRALGSRHQL